MFRRFSGFRRNHSSSSDVGRDSNETSSRRPSSVSPSDPSTPVTDRDAASPSPPSVQRMVAESSIRRSLRKDSVAESSADAGPLGLSVVYTPDNGRKVDIVFIHGLGGTSRQTWSKVKNPDLFWPLTFLPLEPDICLARILTFGYQASLHKSDNIKTILDFAKDLLFELKYAKDDDGEDLNMGNVPLIFVVHSMGGLVVKEAYMQGQNDPEYAHIIKAITAITFLATPHRGTNLAQVLNRILQSAVVTNSKQFISELGKHSLSLQKLNEQFRHIAPKLDIVSFYETQPTAIGLKNMRVMILEKDSSILGYPGETSKALDADHHGVCKYDSRKDPNYVAVRNILKSIVSKIISTTTKPGKPAATNRRNSVELKAVLGITEIPTMDYSFFRDEWVPGTSEWILQEQAFLEWRDASSSTKHRLLWINGGPGTGKSVMSSFIINGLVEQGTRCQYFFIRFGDRKKRSTSFLLRSIAYQIALAIPEFLGKVLELAEDGTPFDTLDPKVIWATLFRTILFTTIDEQEPLYWIIDGLDEADDPRSIVKLLGDVYASNVPIRILIVGRETSEIDSVYQKVHKSLAKATISISGRQAEDMRHYISEELSIPGSSKLRMDTIQRILDGAQNNFLWVRLAVEQVSQCRRETDIEAAFQRLPAGMEALYDRMALSVTQHPSEADRHLAITVLQYATCAVRGLTITQLSQALGEDVSGMMDLQQAIVDLCSGFVVVDNSGNVAMVHQTAREYLLGKRENQFGIDRNAAHEQLFSSCMASLMTHGLRGKIASGQIPDFTVYAAASWSIHLLSTHLDSSAPLQTTKKFLTGPCVLPWIEYLATAGQMQVLVQTSKNLTMYASKVRRRSGELDGGHLTTVALATLESWAVDLIKIVGKFGAILYRNPKAIHKLIAPFCPKSSAIYQCFGKSEEKKLLISGSSFETWDDALARIPLRDEAFASSITVAGPLIFVLVSKGFVLVYDASTFEESPISPITHGERVYMMQVNSNATLCATYGYRTTKVWEMSTGACIQSVDNLESKPRPLAMLFASKRSMLLVGTDDSRIRSISLTHASPTWQDVAELDETELDGHFLNAANLMALSQDGTLVAVAYRGHPLSAWLVEGPVHIGHCWRKREVVARGEVIHASWLPHSTEVLGVYIEGVVFKWNPYTDETEEVGAGANRLSLSKDGSLFATGNGKGTVKVFATSDFSLIYQLTSQDAIFDVAFAPASHRLYDIRGNYANVWEPNALLSFTERAAADHDSESESISHTAASTFCPSIDPITALTPLPNGRFYLYGTENGTIQLQHTQRGWVSRVHDSRGMLRIENLICSPDGRFVCFSDSSKKLMIQSFTPGTAKNADPVMETVRELHLQNLVDGPIVRLLFHPNSRRLLAQGMSSLHTVGVATAEETHTLEQLGRVKRIWIPHPQQPSMLMGFGSADVKLVDWDLREHGTYTYECGEQQNEPAMASLSITESTRGGAKVNQVLVARDKKHILLHCGGSSSSPQTGRLLFLELASFAAAGTSPRTDSDDPTRDWSRTVPAVVLSHDISSQVLRPLSFLPQNRLLFLSRTFAVCSWQLPSGTVNELFYLPGDWISRDCLALCSIWEAEKTFLCPRNGEVVAVKSSAIS